MKGFPKTVTTPDSDVPVDAVVVSIDDVITSHDPSSWQADPRYPAATQERRYDRDPFEQTKVQKIAAELRPDFLLASTPTGLDGPPVVADLDGQLIAMGGNGRTMALKIAYARESDRARAYQQKLRQLVKSKLPPRPVLIRLMRTPPKKLADCSRALNRSLGGGLDPTAQAVSLSRSLPNEIPALLAGKDLAVALRGPVGRDVLSSLARAGLVGRGERGLFEDEGLSETGRNLVRRTLAAAVLGSADLIEALPARAFDQIARAAADLLAAATAGPGWDLRPALRAAAADYNDATRWKAGVQSWIRSPHIVRPKSLDLFGGPELVQLLVQGDLPRFSTTWYQQAIENPEGQSDLFGAVPIADRLRQTTAAILGTGNRNGGRSRAA